MYTSQVEWGQDSESTKQINPREETAAFGIFCRFLVTLQVFLDKKMATLFTVMRSSKC